MPSFFYHLKLELYPTADPSAGDYGSDIQQETIWLPPKASSIFDDLPAHPRKRDTPQRPSLRKQAYRCSEVATAVSSESQRSRTNADANPGVIDCGASRSTAHDDELHNVVFLSERQWRARSESFPPPGFAAGIGPRTAVKDWRFGRVSIESFDFVEEDEQRRGSWPDSRPVSMVGQSDGMMHAAPAASLGPNLGGAGQATKAQYVELETKNTEVGWGVVHLYREGAEPRDFDTPTDLAISGGVASSSGSSGGSGNTITDEEGTILCIPAVPSYLSPSDFLGFVGEKWRGDVSHYRMVMTSKMNRYMVLLKFKDKWRANDWRKEFDGKVFNSMGPEICHVTYIKSITVETPTQAHPKSPENKSDPFASASSSVVNSLKPFPPPTPDLVELPTCPVCLERMDDTSGLMTILCQHVFHCTCLQTWKGSGCPVCRATNPTPQSEDYDANNPYTQPFGHGVSNLCSVCDTNDDLWICLICGNVGCGRYKGGHAKEHWKDTAHSFSLELETQHVWDYAGDMWVHRLIRDKGDGKVFELPSNEPSQHRRSGGGRADDEDVVPRAKLDHIGMEYTHLLTSQLESQRIYFEEMVNKAVDKASKASAAAESASVQAEKALRELSALQAEHRTLQGETVPSLEKDLTRERNRAAKSTDLARQLGKALQEEKQVGEGLMKRIEHVNKELQEVREAMESLRTENEELKETNRDLTMFISGQEKLKEMESDGRVEHGELEEGVLSLPEERKRKGKGKGKK